MKRYIYLLVSVALVLSVLAGCAPKATPTPQPQPTKAQPTVVSPSVAAPTAVPPTAVPAKPKKVVLLMPGRIDDLGWNQAAYEGLKKATEKYKAEMAYVEMIPVADYERYVRDFAQRGFDLIIGHDFLAGDAIAKVAADFPTIWFAWTGVKPLPNTVYYEVLSHEGAYLCGMLAAGMSKTGTVANVMGFDVPDLVRDIEGFKMGARAINPAVKVLVTFTYNWQDPVKGKDAALSAISVGADVLQVDGNPKDYGVFEASKEKGVYVIGRTGDQYTRSPDTVLTSNVRDYYPAYERILGQLVDGTLKHGEYKVTLKDGANYLAPYRGFENKIPQELKDKIKQAEADIKSGKLVVPAATKLSTDTTVLPTPAPTPKKVALLLPGRIDDLGWNQRGYEGLMQLKSKYGADVKYVELVPIADYERYIRQFVQQGYDLIIGHDFMAQDAIFKVAKEYPKLWFAWAGYPVESTNVVPYSVLAQEAAYLTGILAAGMSKTGVVAAMGGFEVPDVVRDIEGFKMGAKAYNPNIKVLVAFTNDWQDPVKGKDTALSLISAGADVIHSDGNPMSLGLFEAAKNKGIYVIGSVGDQYALSPETVLTSEIYGFPTIFDTIYNGMIKGTLKPVFLGPSLKDGGAELAPYHNLDSAIPKELKDKIEQAKQDILSGKLVVPPLDKLTD